MRIRNEETEESQDLTNTTVGAEGCFMQMWVHKEGPSPEDSLRGNLCYQPVHQYKGKTTHQGQQNRQTVNPWNTSKLYLPAVSEQHS